MLSELKKNLSISGIVLSELEKISISEIVLRELEFSYRSHKLGRVNWNKNINLRNWAELIEKQYRSQKLCWVNRNKYRSQKLCWENWIFLSIPQIVPSELEKYINLRNCAELIEKKYRSQKLCWVNRKKKNIDLRNFAEWIGKQFIDLRNCAEWI